ncbi:MAG TPA: hypothetical protein VMB21_03015 [Candidatus Limnocylindria bacterium]|jgi:hypothetical protein|nr:hypothetical protein [Candidatus Limnocylindria bacterium]
MTTNDKNTMPGMELRETLRRFTWLVGMLAVIAMVTELTHVQFGRMIDQRQESLRLTPTAPMFVAR